MDKMRAIGRWMTYANPYFWPTAKTDRGILLQVAGTSIMMSAYVLGVLETCTPGIMP